MLNEFIVSNEVEWATCVGLSTVGARAMVGRLTVAVKRVKDVAPLVTAVHCSVHREALATKTMPADFKTVQNSQLYQKSVAAITPVCHVERTAVKPPSTPKSPVNLAAT